MQAWGHSGSGTLRHAVLYHAGGEKFPTLARWLSRSAWTQPWAALLAPLPFVPKVHLLWEQALAPPPAARTFRTLPARAQARAGKTPRGTSEELAQQELQECRR